MAVRMHVPGNGGARLQLDILDDDFLARHAGHLLAHHFLRTDEVCLRGDEFRRKRDARPEGGRKREAAQ